MQPTENMAYETDIESNRYLAEMINDDMKKAVMPITVFVGIEIFVGFFGNLAVLYVFFFKYHACNFRYFVLCLALTDLTSTLTTMPGEMLTQTHWYIYPVRMVCKIKSFFNVFTVWCEALCLLTIAVDRYRKVCKPHDWQIKTHVAKWLCLGIYATAFVVALPVAFYWGTHDTKEGYNWNETDYDVTVTLCEKDEVYFVTNSKQPLAYSSCVAALLGISLTCMLVLYILIAKKLICGETPGNFPRNKHVYSCCSPKDGGGRSPTRIASPSDIEVSASDVEGSHNGAAVRTSAEPTARTARESKVRRKTLIMFILTVIFIVTTVIYTVLLSLIADGFLKELTDSERAAYFFFFRLYFINHVINPFVYGVLDANFRKTMLNCKRAVGRSVSS